MIKDVTILIEGEETHDIVDALEEVKRLIETGVHFGNDANEDGAYHFEIKERGGE